MPQLYTKSQLVLEMAEDILLQEDYTLVEKIQLEMGIDLLNEEDFSDEALWDITQMSEEEIINVLEDSWWAEKPSAMQQVGRAVSGAVGSVGTTVGTGLTRLGLPGGAAATAHPLIAGAAAIGLGAAAALRMRSNARMRAQARAAGMR